MENRKAEVVYSNGVVSADVVLIHGLEPTHVVVGVRDQVDVDFFGDDSVRGVVCYVLGFQ